MMGLFGKEVSSSPPYNFKLSSAKAEMKSQYQGLGNCRARQLSVCLLTGQGARPNFNTNLDNIRKKKGFMEY